ncbi:MAG TPA: heme utilization cystosolic carrier protein HutX [Candidatus Mucispirillum faecigallinarum]|uniref:Heme utilization cystosolic carrier protein HutX n=1 Tax=Candidatus Mucispirillum faecigallinarum TaxID=2838699 RepID=A0A9D2GUY9_9BACT|nr:heme utilization cystosolic carrier protein HutX [Candidatus Mucispirillum faecigallinarum]
MQEKYENNKENTYMKMPFNYSKEEEEIIEEKVLGYDKLKNDLPALMQEKKPFTISTFARMYGVSDLEVCTAMDENMRTITSGSYFEEIWKELATWEKATVIIEYKGSAFEISAKISEGVFGHGFYNIMGGASAFEGHIKADNIHTIVFSTLPFMSLESLSVLFFDKSGGLIFSVYAGRENRQIIESIKTSFYQMKEKYAEKINERKSLVVYSSLTGNTKKVAEAVQSVIPNCDIFPVENAPENLDDYYFVSVGYWVDRGLPDAKSKKFIKSLKNMNVALFGTLGAYPDSPHALGCIRDSEAMLKKEGSNNNVLGSFLCLGKIDPKLIDYMGKFMGDTHPVTPERKERLLQAQTHPDENDLEQVKSVFKNFAERLRL